MPRMNKFKRRSYNFLFKSLRKNGKQLVARHWLWALYRRMWLVSFLPEFISVPMPKFILDMGNKIPMMPPVLGKTLRLRRFGTKEAKNMETI